MLPRFAQVLSVLVGELVSLVFVEFLLLADKVRHEANIAFTVFLEGEAGIKVEGFAAEIGRHLYQVGLAVVEHFSGGRRTFRGRRASRPISLPTPAS